MDSEETTVIDLERVQFQKGDLIFKQGEESYHFYIIEDGEVEIYLNTNDGGTTTLATIGAGFPIGEFALVAKKPRSAFARAKTPVRAVMIKEAGYNRLLKELPNWALALIKSLIERLRLTDEMLQKQKSIDSDTQTKARLIRK